MAKKRKKWSKTIYKDKKYQILAIDKLGFEISGEYMLASLDLAFIALKSMKDNGDLGMFGDEGKQSIKQELNKIIQEL